MCGPIGNRLKNMPDKGWRCRAVAAPMRVSGLRLPKCLTIKRIHGGRQRATWDQPCADGCITSHDIFGLAQKLSLVVDEIVAG